MTPTHTSKVFAWLPTPVFTEAYGGFYQDGFRWLQWIERRDFGRGEVRHYEFPQAAQKS